MPLWYGRRNNCASRGPPTPSPTDSLTTPTSSDRLDWLTYGGLCTLPVHVHDCFCNRLVKLLESQFRGQAVTLAREGQQTHSGPSKKRNRKKTQKNAKKMHKNAKTQVKTQVEKKTGNPSTPGGTRLPKSMFWGMIATCSFQKYPGWFKFFLKFEGKMKQSKVF